MIRLEKYPDIGEGLISIIPSFHNSVNGTWSYITHNSLVSNAYYRNSTESDGDYLDFNVFLSTGTYVINLLCMKYGSAGIIDFLVDGVEVGSIDTYSVATIYNSLYTSPAFKITSSGLKKLRVIIDGKHAGSASYNAAIVYLGLSRTA